MKTAIFIAALTAIVWFAAHSSILADALDQPFYEHDLARAKVTGEKVPETLAEWRIMEKMK